MFRTAALIATVPQLAPRGCPSLTDPSSHSIINLSSFLSSSSLQVDFASSLSAVTEIKAKEMAGVARLGRMAIETDAAAGGSLIGSDLLELGDAAGRLANHMVMMLGVDSGFGTSFFGFLAAFAAIYLLILDRTNWRTRILTSLLIPYIYLTLPAVLFSFLSGEFGKWVAFIAVVLRLFFPRHFPDWLEMPGSLILLLVVAPEFFSHTIRDGLAGVFICLVIGCYLLQEHIRASGGFRNSFTQHHGISNTIGIILLLVYPVWRLLVHH